MNDDFYVFDNCNNRTSSLCSLPSLQLEKQTKTLLPRLLHQPIYSELKHSFTYYQTTKLKDNSRTNPSQTYRITYHKQRPTPFTCLGFDSDNR